jgi:hypothetical protein
MDKGRPSVGGNLSDSASLASRDLIGIENGVKSAISDHGDPKEYACDARATKGAFYASRMAVERSETAFR